MGEDERVSAGTAPTRILLIEDHQLVREAVGQLLELEPDLAVTGEAADGEAGLRLFARLAATGAVDVVLTDIGLPGIDGLAVARAVKARAPGMPVLLLTMHDEDAYLRGMVEAGADGYVLKQASAGELAAAIRAVVRGEPGLSPGVAGRLVRALREGERRGRATAQLSEREREILGLLAGGLTSKEVAGRLGLTSKTVENHRAHILQKLAVGNTAAAIGLAYQQGLLARAEGGDTAP